MRHAARLAIADVAVAGAALGPTRGGQALDAPDSKLHLLASLSDLDLSLLIAAARMDMVAHTDTVNFAMAYDEYSRLFPRAGSACGRPARASWRWAAARACGAARRGRQLGAARHSNT